MPVKKQLKGEKVNFGCGSRDVIFHGRVGVSGGLPAYGNGSLLTHPQMGSAHPRSVDSAHPPPAGVCSLTLNYPLAHFKSFPILNLGSHSYFLLLSFWSFLYILDINP